MMRMARLASMALFSLSVIMAAPVSSEAQPDSSDEAAPSEEASSEDSRDNERNSQGDSSAPNGDTSSAEAEASEESDESSPANGSSVSRDSASDAAADDRGPPSMSYRLEQGELVLERGDEETERRSIPCEGRAMTRSSSHLYVRCRDKGVLVISLKRPGTPAAVGYFQPEGTIESFFEANNQTWVQLAGGQARSIPTSSAELVSVESSKEDEAPSDEGGSESSSARPVGEVVEVRGEIVVVSLGRSDGIEQNDRIELFRTYDVDMGGESAESEETLAVGRAVTVGESRTQVELGVNEIVEPGQSARPVNRSPTLNAVAPPRPKGLQSFEFLVRPFLAAEDLAGGVIGEMRYKYAFSWPGMLEIQLDPSTVVFGDVANHGALAARASMSFDLPVFRIGLGAGIATISEEIDNDILESGDEEIRRSANLTLTQVVRLGARDGLHLRVYNNFILKRRSFQGGDFNFAYGGTTGQTQISLRALIERSWIISRGGFHLSGQGFGELGLRFLASGNGGAGSLFFEATVGAGTVIPASRPAYFGPLVGFGLEYRR